MTASDRGRMAENPTGIPITGWWDITWRVVKRLGSDNVTLVAGGTVPRGSART
jgi:membrane protein